MLKLTTPRIKMVQYTCLAQEFPVSPGTSGSRRQNNQTFTAESVIQGLGTVKAQLDDLGLLYLTSVLCTDRVVRNLLCFSSFDEHFGRKVLPVIAGCQSRSEVPAKGNIQLWFVIHNLEATRPHSRNPWYIHVYISVLGERSQPFKENLSLRRNGRWWNPDRCSEILPCTKSNMFSFTWKCV